MKRRPPLTAGLLLAAALLLPLPSSATTYLMVSDPNLADQAAVIAELHIIAGEPSPTDAMPATDYLASIDHLLKGTTGGSSIVVRVPGGVRADGKGVRIWGAPEFAPGEHVLLFLVPRSDGTYAILHLMLGAFHLYDGDKGRLAIRNLADTQQVKLQPDGSVADAPGADSARDFGRFTLWLEDRAHGIARAADYIVDLPADVLRSVEEKYTVFNANGLAIRWFQFDSGGSVPFSMYAGGQPGLAGGGFNEFQIAIQAWDSYPLTPIHYVYAGTTTASGGLTTSDGVNAILFGDPHNELSSPFNCATGGILAHGGPWYDANVTGSFNGASFMRTQEADIVTNKGIECFFAKSPNPSKAAQELFAHELGHTLGLGHSCGDSKSPACSTSADLNNALMRTYIHNDGRGAQLATDDETGIRYLYAPGGVGSSFTCRQDQNTLCLLKNRFAVSVGWRNQFNNTSGTGLGIQHSDSTGFFTFGDPSNIELLVKVLDLGGEIKVFYGELTNLHFTLVVTDSTTGQQKTYTNTAGDCGGIDETAFPGNSSAGDSTAATALATDAGLFSAPERSAVEGSSCHANANTLCLLGGRFALNVSWSNPFNASSGRAGAAHLSNLVGTFFFSDPTNVELMTKMIDFGNRVALFYGALSDFGYTLTVTETATGKVKTYQGTPGRLCGGLDNNAFE